MTTSAAQYGASMLQRHAVASLRFAAIIFVSLASPIPSAIAFGEVLADDSQRTAAGGKDCSCEGIWPKPCGLAYLGFALKHVVSDGDVQCYWPRTNPTGLPKAWIARRVDAVDLGPSWAANPSTYDSLIH